MRRSCCGCSPSSSSTCPKSAIPTNRSWFLSFDEAHLLFNEAPKPLLEKIEQVRAADPSKGVGVYS
jgi:hypothetical protein